MLRRWSTSDHPLNEIQVLPMLEVLQVRSLYFRRVTSTIQNPVHPQGPCTLPSVMYTDSSAEDGRRRLSRQKIILPNAEQHSQALIRPFSGLPCVSHPTLLELLPCLSSCPLQMSTPEEPILPSKPSTAPSPTPQHLIPQKPVHHHNHHHIHITITNPSAPLSEVRSIFIDILKSLRAFSA